MQDGDHTGDGIRSFTAAEAREQLADIVNQVAYGKTRVVLTRHGKPIVAVVPIGDLELLDRLEDLVDLEEARRELGASASEGATPWQDVKRRLGL